MNLFCTQTEFGNFKYKSRYAGYANERDRRSLRLRVIVGNCMTISRTSQRCLSRSREIEGERDERISVSRGWKLRHSSRSTRTPYRRTEPIHLRRRIPSPIWPLARARSGVVGKVLFSNKNLTNMPRFAEEWRRSAPSSRRFPGSLPSW